MLLYQLQCTLVEHSYDFLPILHIFRRIHSDELFAWPLALSSSCLYIVYFLVNLHITSGII